jgi:hypothetical protein
MTASRTVKLSLVLVLAAVAGAASVSASLARPKPPPPPVVEAPPPPPPPMPDVAFAASLLRDAAAFRGYMLQTAAISPEFSDPGSVSNALKVGAAYESGQLRRGAVVYAAAAALTDEAFVADVRRAGSTPEARYAIVARIFHDPAYALVFADARGAEGLAKSALAGVGVDLLHSGDQMKQAAYDIQRQPWSLTDVPDRDGRASEVKILSSEPRRARSEDTAAVDRLVAGEPTNVADLLSLPGPYSPLVVHAVALAALAAIGQAGDDIADHLDWLMDDYLLAHCLSAAKLALYECLAVAKPNYEDVFCLGQHAMRDTGECVARSAFVAVPIEVVTQDLAVAPVRTHHPAARRRKHRHS